ncbi:MAG: hypothetical protein ACI9B9_001434, partial [Halioglobus sp.]
EFSLAIAGGMQWLANILELPISRLR